MVTVCRVGLTFGWLLCVGLISTAVGQDQLPPPFLPPPGQPAPPTEERRWEIQLREKVKLLVPERPPTADPREVKLREMEETAAQLLVAMQAAYDAGTVDLELYLKAQDNLAEIQIELANSSAEREKYLKQAIDRAMVLENRIDVLRRNGAEGGESEKYYAAKLHRQRAKLRLLDHQRAWK